MSWTSLRLKLEALKLFTWLLSFGSDVTLQTMVLQALCRRAQRKISNPNIYHTRKQECVWKLRTASTIATLSTYLIQTILSICLRIHLHLHNNRIRPRNVTEHFGLFWCWLPYSCATIWWWNWSPRQGAQLWWFPRFTKWQRQWLVYKGGRVHLFSKANQSRTWRKRRWGYRTLGKSWHVTTLGFTK